MDESRLAESHFAPGAPPPDGCCCWPLWSRLTAAGQRGLAVVVARESDGLRFWLQSRGVDFKHERNLRAEPGVPRDLHINLVTSQAIRYCPWCGRDLAAVAAATPEAFGRVARAHREFAPPPL